MAVKIRLRRTGMKNAPCFRVVAADTKFPRDGRFLEVLGWYDPKMSGVNFRLKMDRIEDWQAKGAELSTTVKSLLKRNRDADGAGSYQHAETVAAESAPAVAAVAEAVEEPAAE